LYHITSTVGIRWGDSDVSPSTTVTAAMLEVYWCRTVRRELTRACKLLCVCS